MIRLALGLLALLFFQAAIAQHWQSLVDFPGVERDDALGFRIGDTLYVGTGLNSGWNAQADFSGFDLANQQFISVASLPFGMERQYATSFVLNGHGYVFGGYNSNGFLNDLWRYVPNTDSWFLCDSLPSFGRSGSAAFVLNNKAYIIGGKHELSAATAEVWCYDGTLNSWTQQAPLPSGPIWRASAVAYLDKGYLLFGRDENNVFLNSFHNYNPQTNQWESQTSFPAQGRSHSGMFALNSGLYTCFGVDSLDQSFNDLWKFDFVSAMWLPLPGLPDVGRRGGVCLSNETAMYYFTGIDEGNNRLKETWRFSPSLTVFNANELDVPSLIGTYDMLGRAIELPFNRLIIQRFSDGKSRLVFQIN
jgi:N-acetylneuraminic acid mutarotase